MLLENAICVEELLALRFHWERFSEAEVGLITDNEFSRRGRAFRFRG
jgi:hypothetical protein